jgi:hypothetical protein
MSTKGKPTSNGLKISKVKFKMFRGAHERKNTKLTIINILFVFFLLAIFRVLVLQESADEG